MTLLRHIFEGVCNHVDVSYLNFKILFLKPDRTYEYEHVLEGHQTINFFLERGLIEFNDRRGSIVRRVKYFPYEDPELLLLTFGFIKQEWFKGYNGLTDVELAVFEIYADFYKEKAEKVLLGE